MATTRTSRGARPADTVARKEPSAATGAGDPSTTTCVPGVVRPVIVADRPGETMPAAARRGGLVTISRTSTVDVYACPAGVTTYSQAA
jgi:hypothetical protein